MVFTDNKMYLHDHQKRHEKNSKKIYAKAIYDNLSDSTDELAFKKGDILLVIEQDTDECKGWWLCSLRGRKGICPGNRLKMLQAKDSGNFSTITSPSSTSYANIYNVPQPQLQQDRIHDLYENTSTIINLPQKHGKRRSWHIMPNKVLTPQKCGDVYLYDLLPTQNRSNPYANLVTMSDPDAYDTPRPAAHINYDSPRSWTPPKEIQQQQQRLDDSYDIPRPLTSLSQAVTPSSSNSSLLTSDSLSLSSSNRSSLAIQQQDYDIPRKNPQPIRSGSATPTSSPLPPTSSTSASSLTLSNYATSSPLQLSESSDGGTYDIPLPKNIVATKQKHLQLQQQVIRTKKELPLELSSALETLAKLQNEATSAVTRLLGFVSPLWRSREKIEPILMDLKLAAVRLRTALHDLAEFGDGALGNASTANDKTLSLKLKPLVKALRDADKLVHETSQNIDCQGWTVDSLAKSIEKQRSQCSPDSLDQLMACAQTLTEDVRQTTSFIQGNATLLFKRSQTPTDNKVYKQNINNNNSYNEKNGNSKPNSEWLEDYDYVSLESKESSAQKNAELRNILRQDIQSNFDNVLKDAETAAISNNDKNELNSNDKSLLIYYATQTVTHMGYLTQAIDAFLQTVERNQPPKFFLAYGKFVVLSAHNIVNIGDIVHRNVFRQDVKVRILQCADALNEALKTCVAKTKKAAQHFPSVTAVQEMVDSVVDISHLAYDLKVAMLQAVQ